jgi:hypothetical protein
MLKLLSHEALPSSFAAKLIHWGTGKCFDTFF